MQEFQKCSTNPHLEKFFSNPVSEQYWMNLTMPGSENLELNTTSKFTICFALINYKFKRSSLGHLKLAAFYTRSKMLKFGSFL